MTKRFGFTLAEVLITLGIIGVVAAMTIPTLIANTNGAKFRSQFKKTLSTLNQAGLMAQAQYDFDYSGAGKCSENGASDNPTATAGMTFCGLLNGTLTGYTYQAEIFGDDNGLKRGDNAYEVGGDDDDKRLTYAVGTYHAYQLADGALVAFKTDSSACTVPIGQSITASSLTEGGALANCLGFIDVNGVTLPNKEVSCASGTVLGTGTCEVPNDAQHMTDIFPVVFHDATVEPATNAARYVLTTSK